jgi:hypothetical protein
LLQHKLGKSEKQNQYTENAAKTLFNCDIFRAQAEPIESIKTKYFRQYTANSVQIDPCPDA